MEPLAPDDVRRIGPYRLQTRLGAGGMGQVYLGRRDEAELAAVKVVHGRFAADPSFRARFAREIEVARAVRGRWVAALLDGDAQAHRPWLATEFVAAPSLDRIVEETGPLAGPALIALAHHLAEALAQLHAQDVVHRDLKPANVLVADDGPRLIDFGVARAIDATAITRTGVLVGTPAFMSPEQTTGAETGPASDVFSFASVLVYAATGTGPFGHTSNALAMLRRITTDAPDLDGVPDRLRPVLGRCLAKDPAARPAPADVAAELGADQPAGGGRQPVRPQVSIGPYRVLGHLGTGRTGPTYLAQAAGGGELAAVTTAHAHHAADPRWRDRFTRDTAAARAVRSPRVAALLDADPDAPAPWTARAFIAGPSLAQQVAANGAMAEPEAFRLAAGLAEGLHALHTSGLVARVLTSSGVLLAEDGPTLIDIGTAGAGGAGPASDLHAFAAVVTYAATGRDDPAGLPDRLREAIAPCFAADPAEHPTAAQMISRLAAGAGALTHAAAPEPAGTKLLTEPVALPASADGGRPRRRLSRRALLVGGGVAAAAAAGVVFATRTPSRAVRWTADPGGITAAAVTGNDPYVVDATDRLHALDPATGAARWTYQLPGAFFATSGSVFQATAHTCYVDVTGEGVCAVDTASGQLRWIRNASTPVVATDDQLICFGIHSTAIGRPGFSAIDGIDPITGATRWSVPLGEDEGAVHGGVVPSADNVHFWTKNRLVTLDTATGALRWELPRPAPDLSVAASGTGLFYAVGRHVVRLDIGTGAVRWRVPTDSSVSWSGPPRLTCTAQDVVLSGSALVGLDAETGERRWNVEASGPGPFSAASWSIGSVGRDAGAADAVVVTESAPSGYGLGAFTYQHRVSALSARTGSTRWTAPLDDGAAAGSTVEVVPAVGPPADTLYVLSDPHQDYGKLHAIALT